MNAHAQPPASEERDFDALAADVERLEALMAHWDESQRSVAFAYRQAIDALHKAALRKLITEAKLVPGTAEALRKASADPVVYGVLRYHGLVRPSQQERVENALASVRPMLAQHGGDVEFVAFKPPDTVEVRFLGNCDGCSASTLTFAAGVKRAIETHCPEIKHVRQVKGTAASTLQTGFVSPFIEKEKWTHALDFDAIPDGSMVAATIDGEKLLFARSAEAVACFRDACAHLGLPISSGALANGRLVCPHHDFEYDIMTGECLTVPEVRLQAVPLRVAGRRVEVRFD